MGPERFWLGVGKYRRKNKIKGDKYKENNDQRKIIFASPELFNGLTYRAHNIGKQHIIRGIKKKKVKVTENFVDSNNRLPKRKLIIHNLLQ